MRAEINKTSIRLIPTTHKELNLLKRCQRCWILGKIPTIVVDQELQEQNMSNGEIKSELNRLKIDTEPHLRKVMKKLNDKAETPKNE